jgi:hypothetical protein
MLAWDAGGVGPRSDDAPAGDDEATAASLEPDDGVTLAERLDRLREQLRMTTFYLTDPDSWR